jgi:hypothetical protein
MATNPDDLFADLVPAKPGSGAIFGAPPKPDAPKEPVFVPQHATQVFDPNTHTYSSVPAGPLDPEAAQKQAAAKQSAEEAADQLIQGIHRARALVSGWSTGAGANLSELPWSTDASKLDAIINQEIRGNIFLNRINMLREENDSPNGGTGIGRIMQAEIPLITGSLGTLDPKKLGRQGTLDSLQEIEARTLRTKAILNGENPDDPAVQKKYNIPPLPKFGAGGGGSAGGGPPSGGGGGGSSPPGVTDLSDDQKHAYAAFLAANPNPSGDQVGAFLTNLTGKTVPNGEEIAKAIKQGRGVSTTVQDVTKKQKVDRLADQYMRQGGGAGAAAVVGAADTISMGTSDEFGGALNAFGGALKGEGSFGDLYDTYTGANREYQSRLRGEHAPSYIGGQIGGGFLLPTGEVSGALDAAKLGAAYGGAYGAGSAEGGLPQRVSGAVTGAIVGAGAGAAGAALAPYAVRLLPSRFRPSQGMAPALADAANAENVDLIRPMVDPKSRAKFGALESDPTAQPIVRGGAENVRGQIEGRVNDLGQGGTPLDTEAAGNIVQQGARAFIQRSKGVANTLYNRARALSGDARFVPQKAIQAVDDQIATLSANKETNAGEINFLNGLKNDLSTDGGKTIEELRQLRQSLRGRINEQNLGSTQAEARAAQALDATELDAAANLPAGAASAYRRADTYYRERAVHIDDVLNRFLGGNVDKGQARLSGEQAFARLKSMTSPGGDGRRLGALMRDLEPNERQDIAATIAQSLGRRSPDEPFSAALFISQTNKLSPSARRTIFGPDGASSIQNLRTLSQALKDAGGDINFSRSTTVANRGAIGAAARRFIAGITGLGPAAGGYALGGAEGGLAGLAAGATAAGIGVGRKVLSARAMVNPRVSRWLAESAQASTPAQAKEATRKLSVIIAREPAISHELKPIYDMLENRLQLPLAANPDQSGGADNEQH